MRKHDEMQAKIAREQGREVRVRIQEEAGSHRKRRSAEIRASEQSHQWDRQREDIHPAEMIERLASVQAKKQEVRMGQSRNGKRSRQTGSRTRQNGGRTGANEQITQMHVFWSGFHRSQTVC